jgi:hypothetical protein
MSIHIFYPIRVGILLYFTLSHFLLAATPREYFVFTPQAYNTFAQPVTGQYYDFEHWATSKKLNFRPSSGDFCPGSNGLLWVYYRSPDQLRVWFRVSSTEEQSQAITVLNAILEQPALRPYRKYAMVLPVTFVDGQCLKPGSMQDGVFVTGLAQTEAQKAMEKAFDNSTANMNELQRAAQKLKEQIDKLSPGDIDKIRKNHGLNKIPSPGTDFTNFDFPGDGDEQIEGGKDTDGDGEAQKGSGSSGKNGIGGVLPDVGFARWFQTLAKLLATYYGIKGLCEQWLMIAYAIAPELFEQVGSFLAKIQHLTTPRTLEDFLDAAADIYNNLEKYLQYFIKAYELLSSGDFQSLMDDLKNMKASTILEQAGKVGALPKEMTNAINVMKGEFDFNFNDLAGLTQQQMQQKLRQKAMEKMRSIAERRAKDLIVSNVDKIASRLPVKVDVSGWYDCARKKDCTEQAKQEAKSIMRQKMPKELQPYVEQIANGDYKGAARQAAYDQIKRRSGIDPSLIGPVFDRLKNNDLAGAIRAIGKDQLHRFGSYQEVAAQIMDGHTPTGKQSIETAARAMGYYLRQIGHPDAANAVERYGPMAVEEAMTGKMRESVRASLTGLSPDVINAFIYKNGEKGVEKLKDMAAIQMGFTDPDARKALLEGRLDEAVRLQAKTGTWGEVSLKKSAREFKQVVANRASLTKYLVETAKISPQYAEEVARKIRTFKK